MRKLLITGLLMLTLAACQPAEDRLRDKAHSLPLPENTVEQASEFSDGQGSQDSCYFTHLTLLFGSDLTYETISSFYKDHLLAEGWVQKFPSWIPEGDYLWFRYGNEYQLSVHYVSPETGGLSGMDYTLAGGSYQTEYTLSLTHADIVAQMGCPFPDD